MIAVTLIIVASIFGFIIGIWYNKQQAITVSDRFTPNRKRTDVQIATDAVMQLQNEIANSGALKMEKLPNGDIRVKLKVVK
jgi:hypothetical protein